MPLKRDFALIDYLEMDKKLLRRTKNAVDGRIVNTNQITENGPGFLYKAVGDKQKGRNRQTEQMGNGDVGNLFGCFLIFLFLLLF